LNNFQVYALAVGSNLTFATAGMVFSIYARRFSSLWISQIKVWVALLAFIVAMLVSGQYVPVGPFAWGYLLLSGCVGLCIGDFFLFRAFATLGAGRSLVLFSCQPLILGIYGYFILDQIFTLNQTLAVICMIICVFMFMLERNKMTGSWDFKSFIWAFLGICLDALGIMLTRSAYEYAPELETFQVNTIRCIGAVMAFILLSPKSNLQTITELLSLRKREQSLVATASLFGCFVSLSLYLAALKYAHVGTLTAISITGPVWVSLLECVYYRKWPNFILLTAFAFFITGFYLMVLA
jgi:drug/metabolite transporter (DMT)-like permease